MKKTSILLKVLLHAIVRSSKTSSKIQNPNGSRTPSKIQMDFWMQFLNSLKFEIEQQTLDFYSFSISQILFRKSAFILEIHISLRCLKLDDISGKFLILPHDYSMHSYICRCSTRCPFISIENPYVFLC